MAAPVYDSNPLTRFGELTPSTSDTGPELYRIHRISNISTRNVLVNEIIECDGYQYHTSSYIDRDAKIGPGCQIWHFCHVVSAAVVGADWASRQVFGFAGLEAGGRGGA